MVIGVVELDFKFFQISHGGSVMWLSEWDFPTKSHKVYDKN